MKSPRACLNHSVASPPQTRWISACDLLSSEELLRTPVCHFGFRAVPRARALPGEQGHRGEDANHRGWRFWRCCVRVCAPRVSDALSFTCNMSRRHAAAFEARGYCEMEPPRPTCLRGRVSHSVCVCVCVCGWVCLCVCPHGYEINITYFCLCFWGCELVTIHRKHVCCHWRLGSSWHRLL